MAISKEKILEHAPFDPDQNIRIYEKFFSGPHPRRLKTALL